MTAFALASFTALLVTINPIEAAALFSGLTERTSAEYRRHMAIKSTVVATVLMLVFLIFGDDLLRVMGITLPGVRVGGGILLLLVAIKLVFGQEMAAHGGAAHSSPGAADISVFPLATPVIAGPGAITAAVVQASEARNELVTMAVLLAMFAVVMALTLAAMLVATRLQGVLGDTGMNVVTRMLGILLTALSAEMILTGIKDSGAFAG